MQATFTKCGLNRTSLQDRWMVSDDSPVYVGNRKLGALSKISSDWTARIIIANAIYFNAVNVLEDHEADKVIAQTFKLGGDTGQKLIAPTYHWVHEKIDAGQVSSQIASRIMLYMFAINWTVARPHPSFEPRVHQAPKPSEKIIRFSRYDDGDYGLMLGDPISSSETVSAMSMEINRLIITGFADVDFMYFSQKPLLTECAQVTQKYIKEKWGYDFEIKDDT